MRTVLTAGDGGAGGAVLALHVRASRWWRILTIPGVVVMTSIKSDDLPGFFIRLLFSLGFFEGMTLWSAPDVRVRERLAMRAAIERRIRHGRE